MRRDNPHTALCVAVVVELRRRGHWAHRNEVGSGVTNGGTPITYGLGPGSADIIACIHGHFVGIECKTGTGRQEPDQRAWQRAHESCGGMYWIVRSVEDLRERLARAA